MNEMALSGAQSKSGLVSGESHAIYGLFARALKIASLAAIEEYYTRAGDGRACPRVCSISNL